MKKIFSLLLLAALVAMQSCEKHDDRPKDIVINANLAAGEEYRLDLKQYGKESSIVTITQQAANASVSEIISNTMTYHYQSAPKTTATDKVMLQVTKSEHHDCGNGHHDDGEDDDDDAVTKITLNFTVK